MRPCPVCGDYARDVVDVNYFDFELYKCNCRMHYVDHYSLSQEWFDLYYTTKYKTDDKPYSDERLSSLARFVASYEPRNVLDIGGMDGELQSILNASDVLCDISGVNDINQNKYDIVVLSHTLEHIYDVSGMFKRIKRNLESRLIIEIPVWYDYSNLKYDYHWQHINKFTSYQLETLLLNQGFRISLSSSIPDYREYHCHRIMAWTES